MIAKNFNPVNINTLKNEAQENTSGTAGNLFTNSVEENINNMKRNG